MASSTRQARIVAEGALDALGEVTLRTATELFAAANALHSSKKVRAALSDPSAEAASKEQLVRKVFGSKLSGEVVKVLIISANERWSSPRDMADSIESLGVRAIARSTKDLDGLQTEKGSGKQQKSYYAKEGFSMLPEHATWPDGGNGVEAGILELYRLMTEGKFKVFDHIADFFDEKMNYHRDESGKIVKTGDDLLDALRYAYMMRRYAVQKKDIGNDTFTEPLEFNSLW
jgi:hypothetical protein